MSGEAAITQKLNNLKLVYCTTTKKKVVAEVQQEFIIPNGLATWLHCEACRGWHVMIDSPYLEEKALKVGLALA
jgi:hypothetical protein